VGSGSHLINLPSVTLSLAIVLRLTFVADGLEMRPRRLVSRKRKSERNLQSCHVACLSLRLTTLPPALDLVLWNLPPVTLFAFSD